MAAEKYELDLIEISPKIHLLREGRARDAQALSILHLHLLFAILLTARRYSKRLNLSPAVDYFTGTND